MTSLEHSIFHTVFYPPSSGGSQENIANNSLRLSRSVRLAIAPHALLSDYPLVVFDFETTGLDPSHDRIIEVGAIRIENFRPIKELSHLLSTSLPLSPKIQKLTGITPAMLVGKPAVAEVLPEFLEFIDGAILVAHNADFDLAFLKAECQRNGIILNWPTMCSLKLARTLLPDLERKNLDALAQYYDLEFESRHRSIGDVKVTIEVLKHLLQDEGPHLQTWGDLQNFVSD